jgi:hypothetical protein
MHLYAVALFHSGTLQVHVEFLGSSLLLQLLEGTTPDVPIASFTSIGADSATPHIVSLHRCDLLVGMSIVDHG